MEYKSEEELFNSLRGAFNVKLRLIKDNYSYIKMIDIWNYLKLNKWIKTKNLSISEMVNDIIDVDIEKIRKYFLKYKSICWLKSNTFCFLPLLTMLLKIIH